MSTIRLRTGCSHMVLTIGWFLAVEFLDELVDGFLSTAWPAIKGDLHLSLAQIGLLLGVPRLVGNVIEMPLGLLADVTPRRRLISIGGLSFALASALLGIAPGFVILMAGLLLFNPASGAFVSVSQACLMDLAPHRREQNMARWALAGSLGNLVGPLLFGAAVALGAGWRPVFGLIAGLAVVAVLTLNSKIARGHAWQVSSSAVAPADGAPARLADALAAAWRKGALRWLVLLESSDLMLDVFRGYLALYLVEVVAASQEFASLTVVALTLAGLTGGVLMVPLLARISGIAWLRFTALGSLVVFPAFLLVGPPEVKLMLVTLLGLLTSGWYSVLKAGLYAQLPGQSGAAMALSNIGGLVSGVIPIVLGFVAQHFGLQTTMWLLLAAPAALLIGLPREQRPS